MDETTVPVCELVPDGVNTGNSGMTLETLDLMPGFFRTSKQSKEVLECNRKDACLGGPTVALYCAEGYTGPCEGFYLLIANMKGVGCGTLEFHGVFFDAFNSCIE